MKATFFQLAFTVRKLAEFEAYYAKHFGFRRTRVIDLGDDAELVFLKNEDGFYFEVFPPEEERPYPMAEADGPHYPGLRHIAFQVDDVEAKLEEMGDDGKVTLGPLHFDDFIPGWKTVWLKDPEGNIVEITQGYKDRESME